MKFDSIIKGPIITEKTNAQMSKENKYSFKVYRDASKGAVKQAIEKLYKVKVVDVNILATSTKSKRSMVGKRLNYSTAKLKKAIVKLEDKQTIDLFSGGNK